MKQASAILAALTLTACSTTPVQTKIIEPVCEPPESISVNCERKDIGDNVFYLCPQRWVNEIGTNIVRLKECILSWESAAETHNQDAPND